MATPTEPVTDALYQGVTSRNGKNRTLRPVERR